VRRHADHDGAYDAITNHAPYNVRDKGLPIPHADIYGQMQFIRNLITLLQSPVGKGGRPNQGIAMGDFVDSGLGKRTAASHVSQVFRNLPWCAWAPMGQQQDRCCRIVSLSGQADQVLL
jgi:hypothetical protein